MSTTWHQGHYNAIAKEIREVFSNYDDDSDFMVRTQMIAARASLAALAIRFAKRFKKYDNEFDPLKWLDQCSSNTDLYPLSELWEEYGG